MICCFKAKADELVCHHWRAMEQLGTGGLLDYSDFLIQTMQLLHNEADFDLVFHQLMFDQKVLLYQDEERKVSWGWLFLLIESFGFTCLLIPYL